MRVGELAAAAQTTTGPLYHHFGSKEGLYTAVRADVERRVLDRMEGALAAGAQLEGDALAAALLVAFDYAERAGFARLLSEPHPEPRPDPVAAVLGDGPLGAMLAAALASRARGGRGRGRTRRRAPRAAAHRRWMTLTT